jgi:hypothetical protein
MYFAPKIIDIHNAVNAIAIIPATTSLSTKLLPMFSAATDAITTIRQDIKDVFSAPKNFAAIITGITVNMITMAINSKKLNPMSPD